MDIGFTLLDYVIIAGLAASATLSLLRGFSREILSIVGWLVSIYGTLAALPLLRPHIEDAAPSGWPIGLLLGIAAIVVFVLIMLVFSFLANIVTKHLKKTRIGRTDRILGAGFGLLRGVLIAIFAYFILLLLIPTDEHPDWVSEAQLVPFLHDGMDLIVTLAPSDSISAYIPARFPTPDNLP